MLTFDTDVLELWHVLSWIGSWDLGHWWERALGRKGERGERRELAWYETNMEGTRNEIGFPNHFLPLLSRFSRDGAYT